MTHRHVLITTRRILDDWRGRCLMLDCFSPEESASFLRKAVMTGDSPRAAAKAEGEVEVLAERLGYLPLALAVAAAYMQRCDVSPAEYIRRYDERQQLLDTAGGLGDEYPRTVAGSLALSLERIENERCVLEPCGAARLPSAAIPPVDSE